MFTCRDFGTEVSVGRVLTRQKKKIKAHTYPSLETASNIKVIGRLYISSE